jgi:DNA-directed RNA polymerase specialized sigma24 family protein
VTRLNLVVEPERWPPGAMCEWWFLGEGQLRCLGIKGALPCSARGCGTRAETWREQSTMEPDCNSDPQHDLALERLWVVAHRVALSILKDNNHAEDVAQETMIQFLEMTLTTTTRSEHTLVARIARNCAITELRRRRRSERILRLLAESRIHIEGSARHHMRTMLEVLLEDHLTPRQARALNALCTNPSPSSAARELGVSVRDFQIVFAELVAKGRKLLPSFQHQQTLGEFPDTT